MAGSEATVCGGQSHDDHSLDTHSDQQHSSQSQDAECSTPESGSPCTEVTLTPRKSAIKRRVSEEENGGQPAKRRKKNVSFDGVTVYYFQRKQGFICVPSCGGSTLGMEEDHELVQSMTLAEHEEALKEHHDRLLEQWRQEGTLKNMRRAMLGLPPKVSRREESGEDESAEDSDDSDDLSTDESSMDDYLFLQPLTVKRRRAVLRAAGVTKIEHTERTSCLSIRESRELCGCTCRGECRPDTCSCARSDISCQVDRTCFPCGCTKQSCGNPAGRLEFNAARVRSHFLNTLVRLEVDRQREQQQQQHHHHHQQQQQQQHHHLQQQQHQGVLFNGPYAAHTGAAVVGNHFGNNHSGHDSALISDVNFHHTQPGHNNLLLTGVHLQHHQQQHNNHLGHTQQHDQQQHEENDARSTGNLSAVHTPSVTYTNGDLFEYHAVDNSHLDNSHLDNSSSEDSGEGVVVYHHHGIAEPPFPPSDSHHHPHPHHTPHPHLQHPHHHHLTTSSQYTDLSAVVEHHGNPLVDSLLSAAGTGLSTDLSTDLSTGLSTGLTEETHLETPHRATKISSLLPDIGTGGGDQGLSDVTQQSSDDDTDEGGGDDEDFGEMLKKSLVETVS